MIESYPYLPGDMSYDPFVLVAQKTEEFCPFEGYSGIAAMQNRRGDVSGYLVFSCPRTTYDEWASTYGRQVPLYSGVFYSSRVCMNYDEAAQWVNALRFHADSAEVRGLGVYAEEDLAYCMERYPEVTEEDIQWPLGRILSEWMPVFTTRDTPGPTLVLPRPALVRDAFGQVLTTADDVLPADSPYRWARMTRPCGHTSVALLSGLTRDATLCRSCVVSQCLDDHALSQVEAVAASGASVRDLEDRIEELQDHECEWWKPGASAAVTPVPNQSIRSALWKNRRRA